MYLLQAIDIIYTMIKFGFYTCRMSLIDWYEAVFVLGIEDDTDFWYYLGLMQTWEFEKPETDCQALGLIEYED